MQKFRIRKNFFCHAYRTSAAEPAASLPIQQKTMSIWAPSKPLECMLDPTFESNCECLAANPSLSCIISQLPCRKSRLASIRTSMASLSCCTSNMATTRENLNCTRNKPLNWFRALSLRMQTPKTNRCLNAYSRSLQSCFHLQFDCRMICPRLLVQLQFPLIFKEYQNILIYYL